MSGNNSFRYTSGPAAVTIYNDSQESNLTIDWSYDAIYFKYKNSSWITLSIGPKTTKNEVNKINGSKMINIFKNLIFYALNNKNLLYPTDEINLNISNELHIILDLFI